MLVASQTLARRTVFRIVIPAVVALIVIFIVIASTSPRTAIDIRPSAISTIVGRHIYGAGLPVVVGQELSPNPISLHRGDNATITMKLIYKTNGEAQPLLTLRNFHGDNSNFVVMPSGAIDSQTLDALLQNVTVHNANPHLFKRNLSAISLGVIPYDQNFVDMVPNANSTLTLHVYLSKYLEDDFVGYTYGDTILYEISPSDTIHYQTSQDLGIHVLN